MWVVILQKYTLKAYHPIELLPHPCRSGGGGEGGGQAGRHLVAFLHTVCVCVEKSKVNLLSECLGITLRSFSCMVGWSACLTFEQQHPGHCIAHKIKCVLNKRKWERNNFLLGLTDLFHIIR